MDPGLVAAPLLGRRASEPLLVAAAGSLASPLVSDWQLVHDPLAYGRPQRGTFRSRTPTANTDHLQPMPPRRRPRGVLALFEGGVQKPVLLAHVVPVEDADLTTAGGRLLSVLAVAAVEITPVERTS
jgi:hypothetical protein